MVRVKFFSVDKTTKQKITSSNIYYQELNDININLIHAQQINLQKQIPDSKILIVFENVDIKLENI
jgi:hypothetical protein